MPRSGGIGRTGGKQKRARAAAAPEAAAKRQATSIAALNAAVVAAEAALKAEQTQADGQVRAWLADVLLQLEPPSVPRPAAPEQHTFSGYGETEEEALAALKLKNNLCTCAQGVPSFLCRVRWCWAFEVGTCEPMVRPPNEFVSRYSAHGCKCIQWARITDSGRILKDEDEDGADGIFTSCSEVVSGEHDEVRRKVFYQGDPQTAVRRWPPRRVRFCEGCCCSFGSYVRTCDSDLIQCWRAGRSVMVVSEGGDLAVTCVIRCMGGERKRCRMSNNASGHCNLYHLPDCVIHRSSRSC